MLVTGFGTKERAGLCLCYDLTGWLVLGKRQREDRTGLGAEGTVEKQVLLGDLQFETRSISDIKLKNKVWN